MYVGSLKYYNILSKGSFYVDFYTFFFNFTLYLEYSRVGRILGTLGSQELYAIRQSVPIKTTSPLSANSEGGLSRYQSEGNENNKYFTSSSGNRTHNLTRLQSHAYFLPHDWPQSIFLFFTKL